MNKIKKIAIIGTGVIGAGWIIRCLSHDKIVYAFDKDLKLVYRGRYDDSRPGSEKAVTGKDLHSAIDHLLINKEVNIKQYPSMGCNIKWH